MPSPTDFVPGKLWTARATPRNQLNGIAPDGFVWITLANGPELSLYVDQGARRLRISREALTGNFHPASATPPNRAYIGMLPALVAYR